MKLPFTLLIILSILIFASCTTTEDSLTPTGPNGPTTDASGSPILLELSDTDWNLVDCPGTSSLEINGYNECEYLNRLSFNNTIVYIKHTNQFTLTPHHICYVTDDNNLVVSRQSCSQNSWSSMFEWEIVSLHDETMIITVTAPNIDPSFSSQFEYVKVG